MVRAFVDCNRYGHLINKSFPLKNMYRSIHRFFSVLENKKYNNKVQFHNIKSNKVNKYIKYITLIDLFHIVFAHACIGHVTRYFSIIGDNYRDGANGF